jgi:hypothetical protein
VGGVYAGGEGGVCEWEKTRAKRGSRGERDVAAPASDTLSSQAIHKSVSCQLPHPLLICPMHVKKKKKKGKPPLSRSWRG